jgi:hypothetical protein
VIEHQIANDQDGAAGEPGDQRRLCGHFRRILDGVGCGLQAAPLRRGLKAPPYN